MWHYFIDVPDGTGGSERFIIGTEYSPGFFIRNIREGTYFTTSTKGVPGNTYTLKVEHAGKEYTATDYMCHGTAIDSVSIEPVGKYIYDKPDGTDGFLVPCLYFAEPQDEDNFYMFTAMGSSSYVYGYGYGQSYGYELEVVPVKDMPVRDVYGGINWPISVVSDRFMSPYVFQYKMSDGDQYRKYYSGTDMGFYSVGWENGGVVNMYCISEAAYRFYAELSRQYYNDGGVFSPSPASPPTNISGGAQGCFSAASVSQYVVDLRNIDKK
jgi:hypothetical protein